MNKRAVLSLGGSVITSNKPFVEAFVSLIREFAGNGWEFIVYSGGGKLAREFQQQGKKIGMDDTGLDWLGIYASRIHAHLLCGMLSGVASPEVITDPTLPVNFSKPVICAGGWKPGWSTDFDAVKSASLIGAKKVLNITNVDGVYDKDPSQFPDAKKLAVLSWPAFQKLVGKRWTPGLSMPFDPIASREAAMLGLKVCIIGPSIGEVRKALHDEGFFGTVIS
ncbi:TPA: UMP kinase [Candidatus Woesearchaeota archaeon]|nr:UMP kinase [Candidatus Woesearchaeota archaeon]HII68684.1 UMP kinase [Candidatus Woesearchaeota archaeon]